MDKTKGLTPGMAAGAIWGCGAYAVNYGTGIFPYEGSFAANLTAFVTGGALFGLVAGGLLSLLRNHLPFSSIFAKSLFFTVGLWALFRGGAILLSAHDPYRYHGVMAEAIQGFFLALLLGGILGILMEREEKNIAGGTP